MRHAVLKSRKIEVIYVFCLWSLVMTFSLRKPKKLAERKEEKPDRERGGGGGGRGREGG